MGFFGGGGGGGTTPPPGTLNKQVIFNDNGVLAGDPAFLYEKGTDYLNVNALVVGSTNIPATGTTLQVDGVTGGLLPPRMTTTQRDALGLVPDGLVIFNTTTGYLNVRSGGTWHSVNVDLSINKSYSASITSSIPVSPPNSIWSMVGCDTSLYDPWGMHGTGGFNYALVIPVSGNYLLKARIRMPPVASNGNAVGFSKNGANANLGQVAVPVSGAITEVDYAISVPLVAQDYVAMQINNQTGAYTIPIGASFPVFTASLIGP